MSRLPFAMAVAMLATLLAPSSAALAGQGTVDPSTLSPVPPADAVCTAVGSAVICETVRLVTFVDEAAFELPCGLVYASGVDDRTYKRWYKDEQLTRRSVHQSATGTWTLSPGGAAPVVSVATHTSWGEDYLVPGDLSSAVGSQQGADLVVRAPSLGVIVQIAGQTHGEERFTGRFLTWEDPTDPALSAGVTEDLCAALTS